MAEIPSTIGRYEIVSRLGQGGMGSLYLARDPKIGRLVAIKLVRQEFDSPEARQRFAREAQSAGTLRHPNIVTIFDVDEHDGLPFIAMEYVEGETLAEIVRRKAPSPLAARLQWIEQLCAGLAYAHRQGVVHRDVKPANLMVDHDGALKILDFGLARREASKFTQSQAIIGTPHYMSPEQIRAGDVGPPSDIFAVGAVLYELLAYAEAFPGSVHQAMHRILYEEPRPLRETAPGIDAALEAIVARAIEKDPARRFDDLSRMRGEIEKVRLRLSQRPAEDVQTIAMTTPAPRRAGSDSVPPSSHASTGSGSGSGSRRDSAAAHRVTLQKRRAAQIEAHLADARRHCDNGALEAARQSLDQALMFDPDHPGALQLMEEIAAEEERRQIADAVAAARAALQLGNIDGAAQALAPAVAIAPNAPAVVELKDLIDTARREIERARQVQEILRRARARFAEGSFEGAIRAAGELLAIDPQNAAARDLEARAHEAIEARSHRAERDAAAQAAVTAARALFESGDKAGALARLESFAPPHDLVTSVLASLRGEKEEVAARTAAATAPSRMASMRVYVAAAATIAIVAMIGFYAYTRPRGAEPQPLAAPPAATAPAASTTSSPAMTASPVVTPPPSLAAQPAPNDNDRDAMQAYRLLASGQPDEAAKVVTRLARRDPKNEYLRDLRSQLQSAAAAPRPPAAEPASNQGQPPSPQRGLGEPGTTLPLPSTSAAAAANPAPALPSAPAPKPELPAAGAGLLPGTTVPPPSRPAAEIERPAIEASIAEYARALSSRDLPAVARVRRYTPAEARNWENVFKQFSEYRLIVKVTGAPVVDGDRATVPVEEQFAQTAKKGGIQVFSQPRRTNYLLQKLGGRWMILPPI